MSLADDGLDLMVRTGLPDDLKVLLEKYPRAGWDLQHHIGDLGRFWLERHDAFRGLGGALVASIDALREERVATADFARWFAPRLNHFLGDLQGHHLIEDHQYFPRFAAADRRLAAGFGLLEEDHHVIHELLETNAATGREFYEALVTGDARLAYARDAYATQAERLLKGLMRHLEDEEDLIIPLLMEQGEDRFG